MAKQKITGPYRVKNISVDGGVYEVVSMVDAQSNVWEELRPRYTTLNRQAAYGKAQRLNKRWQDGLQPDKQDIMATLPLEAHITYQLQYRKCNKPHCITCHSGQRHGPYTYAYWRENGRLKSKYIGKGQIKVEDLDISKPPTHLRHNEDIIFSDTTFSRAQWLALAESYNYTCLCCKRSEPEIKLVADHVVPTSRGGMNTLDNIQPLCFSCNAKKGVKSTDYR